MSKTNTSVAPLMARIELTADEWAEVRVAALERKVTTQRLIGDVLRAFLRVTGDV